MACDWGNDEKYFHYWSHYYHNMKYVKHHQHAYWYSKWAGAQYEMQALQQALVGFLPPMSYNQHLPYLPYQNTPQNTKTRPKIPKKPTNTSSDERSTISRVKAKSRKIKLQEPEDEPSPEEEDYSGLVNEGTSSHIYTHQSVKEFMMQDDEESFAYVKFLESSKKHQNKYKNNVKAQMDDVREEEEKMEAARCATPEAENTEDIKENYKLLYGSGDVCIQRLEALHQLQYDKWNQTNQPEVWPVIPLRMQFDDPDVDEVSDALPTLLQI